MFHCCLNIRLISGCLLVIFCRINEHILLILMQSIVFHCFLRKRIKINRVASIIRRRVQKRGKKGTAPLDECHITYDQLTMIKIAWLCWPCDELYITTLFFHLSMSQSNDIDDAMNDVIMVVENGAKIRWS